MSPSPKRRLLRLAARPRLGAAAPADDPGSVGRVPILVAVAALALGAFVIDQRVGAPDPATVVEAAAVPLASDAGAPASSWYCAAGTARGNPGSPTAPAAELVAEHHLVVTNAGGERRPARVTLFPADGEPVTKPIDLPAHGRVDVAVADHVTAPFASALVEADGGLVTAVHRLEGSHGSTTGACASSSSSSWFFPAGTSSPRSKAWFVLFNPFRNQAVASVELKVQDVTGRQLTKKPEQLQAVVVPAQRTVVLDVSSEVANNDRWSARVETRDPASHIVVDRLLADDGDADDPRHVSVVLGATAAAPTWAFADGRQRAAGTRTEYVVYNPGTEPVDAELRVRVDRYDVAVPPFVATVQPGEFRVISPDDDAPAAEQQRVPVGSGYWATAVARSGGSFVVERVTRASTATPTGTTAPPEDPEADDEDEDEGGAPTTTTTTRSTTTTRPSGGTSRPGAGSGPTTTTTAGRGATTTTTTTPAPAGPLGGRSVLDLRGVMHTMGSPVLAREWIVPAASVGARDPGIVAVTNLAGRSVKLTVYAEVDGRTLALREYEDVELPDGVRTTVDLTDPSLPGGSSPRGLRVVADGPVVVGLVAGVAEPSSLWDLHGVPVRGTLAVPGPEALVAVAQPPASAPGEAQPAEGEGGPAPGEPGAGGEGEPGGG